MKRRLLFLILFILLFFIIINTTKVIAETTITGEAITGKASAQQVGMNISIVSTLPTLTIISPADKTYINEWVLLNYTTTNAQSIWYKLDNGPNTTINFPFYFNTSEGSHTLYLYANNSAGTNFTNITFAVNLTRFIINYSKWQGDYIGDSTNFSRYSYEEMQNLSNIIFEHINYGKMFFYEEINFTHDASWSDNFLDLNSYINISFNKIELNSSALPNFNKSATLRIYNLTLTNPRIAKDGFVCPSNICVIESYSNGVLVFNVTGFSTYSAEETPTTSSPPPGGGGGGGSFKKDFSLDKEKIQISLKQGETKKLGIEIKNTGEMQLSITLSTELEDFIKISETSFSLEAGKSKIITLDIIARENILPDLYIGKILVNGEGIEKEILISVEVESENPLFKIRMEIPKTFLQVTPGKNIPATIKIWREGGGGEANVEIDYLIKSDMAEIIFSEQETRTVETQTSFTKEIKIPEYIKPGNYFLYAKVTYNSKTASSSTWFLVKKTLLNEKNLIYLVILISIMIIILIRAIKRAGNRHEK